VRTKGWRENDRFAEFADIVDSGMRGGVNFDDIKTLPLSHDETVFAFPTRFCSFAVGTVDSFGKESGKGCFAGTAGTGKEIGLTNFSEFEGVFESGDDVFLPNYFGKFLRTVFAVKSRGGHRKRLKKRIA
jgi:hypothetical protein